MNEQAAKLTRWLLAGNGALKNVAQLLTQDFGPTGVVAAAIDAATITAYPVDPGARPQGQEWTSAPEGWSHPLRSSLLPSSTSASHHVVVGITSRNQVLVVNLAAADYLGIEGDNPILMMRSWLIQVLSKTPTAEVAVTDPALAMAGAERLALIEDPGAAPAGTSLILSTHHTSAPAAGQPHPITVSSQAADAANVVLCNETVAGIYLANRYWPVWRRMEIADERWEHLKTVLVPAPEVPTRQVFLHAEQGGPALADADRPVQVFGRPGPSVSPQSLDERQHELPPWAPLTSDNDTSLGSVPTPSPTAASDGHNATTSDNDTSPDVAADAPETAGAQDLEPVAEGSLEPAAPPAISAGGVPTSGNDTSPAVEVDEPAAAAVQPGPSATLVTPPLPAPGGAADDVDAAAGTEDVDAVAEATNPSVLEPAAPPAANSTDLPTSGNDTSPAVEVDEPAAAAAQPGPPAPSITPPLLTPGIPASLVATAEARDTGAENTPLLPGRPAEEPTEPGLYVLGPVYALGVDPDTNEPTRHSAVTRQGVRKPVKALMAVATSNGVTLNEWGETILQVTPQNRRQLRTQIRKMMGGHDPIRSDLRGLLVVDMFCDWKEFNRLVGKAPESATTEALSAAVNLIRGRPFEDVPEEEYSWRSVELLKDELIDLCSTAAAELAQRQHATGARAAAYQTARLGLRVYAQREDLWLIAAESVADHDRKELIWDLKHAIPVPTHPQLRQLLSAARAS
ncbi:hypothetical protein HG717_32195 [Rhodococcus erythropolis]|uniref:hypothetical protein n=1 Tax=Rhodococcus erythropolis TaxID=1833 RepID=UPI001C9AAED1|nr:hypothetical protein [Rhodococcus erythropolis]MBY6388545.1 hypothetical protein [Rhodococcus erythropolis]